MPESGPPGNHVQIQVGVRQEFFDALDPQSGKLGVGRPAHNPQKSPLQDAARNSDRFQHVGDIDVVISMFASSGECFSGLTSTRTRRFIMTVAPVQKGLAFRCASRIGVIVRRGANLTRA